MLVTFNLGNLRSVRNAAQITLLISPAIKEEFHFDRQLELSVLNAIIIKILTICNFTCKGKRSALRLISIPVGINNPF